MGTGQELIRAYDIALSADAEMRAMCATWQMQPSKKLEWPKSFIAAHLKSYPNLGSEEIEVAWCVRAAQDGTVFEVPILGGHFVKRHEDIGRELLQALGFEPKRIGQLREPLKPFLPNWAIENGKYITDSYGACEIAITSTWGYVSEVSAYRARLINELQDPLD